MLQHIIDIFVQTNNFKPMKDKILLVVAGLFGLMMLNSGLNKFLQYMPMPELSPEAGQTIGAFVQSGWLFGLVAVAEIIGGILIIIPKTRALGAIIIFPVMMGILLFHIVQAPEALVMTLVLFAINVWVIIDSKDKYMPMIQK